VKILVTGAGGALGGHLVRRLLDDGHEVRAVDIKPLDKWWQVHETENWAETDLSLWGNARDAVYGAERVYQLAANMGGIGFITDKEADCAFTVLTTAHMIKAAAEEGVSRFVYASSACAYPVYDQQETDAPALREDAAWPADPDHGYGLEKLFGEKLCEYAHKDWGLETRVARLHNVYGPHGEWQGGREKAPAAIARKIATAKRTGEHVIDVWGDGEQTRSYCWVGDFVEGIIRIGDSACAQPLNLGSSELVSINQLIDIVSEIADYPVERRYDLTKPQGVRGRNSCNDRIREVLGWEPSTSLHDGLSRLYPWIERRVRGSL